MKLQLIAAALAAVVLGGASAHAQFGVYGTLNTQRMSGVKCADIGPTGTNLCSYNDGVDRVLGGGGGLYYDWKKMGPAVVGVDVRATIMKSNKTASLSYSGVNATRSTEVLGGVRGRFSARHDFLSPYAEALFGYSKRTLSAANTSQDFFAYRGVAGLDINLAPVVAVRLPEVSIGQNIGMGGAATNTVESISVGIVFHLPNGR